MDCRELLLGFRFSVCDTNQAVSKVLELRSLVYGKNPGYHIPVPDSFDRYSWHLLAEDVYKGIPVGSMRVTPWGYGPLEVETHFMLPPEVEEPTELSRFSILPEYRRGSKGLPVVSIGLFILSWQIINRISSKQMVCASIDKLIPYYELLQFDRTGIRTSFENFGGKEHELLTWEYSKAVRSLPSHPLREFFEEQFPEIITPTVMPKVWGWW